MERVIGRMLVAGESVHHKNGMKTDNQPENLELWYSWQPGGQRVDDLIDYVITNHRSRLLSRLSKLCGECVPSDAASFPSAIMEVEAE